MIHPNLQWVLWELTRCQDQLRGVPLVAWNPYLVQQIGEAIAKLKAYVPCVIEEGDQINQEEAHYGHE
jgi:hypothetical protein